MAKASALEELVFFAAGVLFSFVAVASRRVVVDSVLGFFLLGVCNVVFLALGFEVIVVFVSIVVGLDVGFTVLDLKVRDVVVLETSLEVLISMASEELDVVGSVKGEEDDAAIRTFAFTAVIWVVFCGTLDV